LLSLRERPAGVTPLNRLEIDWPRTVAWGEGGYYGRIFMNVQGREPNGVVPPARYDDVREELADSLAGIPDDNGRPMDTKVYRPNRIYRATRGVAPDLMVYFDNLNWRSNGFVGHDRIYTFDNDTGPDDANHAEEGLFIMRGPGIEPRGRLGERCLIDLAPTILERFGYPIPADMQGRPLLEEPLGAQADR
jgi:predicted AlkP superfamily phosphohydrolase/phosphomutase